MRVGFLLSALIVVAFAGAPGSPASATRTTFAQSQQPRTQAQSQEGLPPDKKKTLSNFGPDDVFGVPEEDPRKQSGKQGRKPQPTPALQSSPSQRPPATSPAAPSAQPSASPVQSSSPEPSPTVAAAPVENGIQSPPLGQGEPSYKI